MNISKKIILSSLGLITLYSYVSHKQLDQNQLIKNVLSYSIPADIITRCQKDHNYTDQDMIILENELKKFFILSEKKQAIGMYSKDVDNLWHTFILFTKDYAHFCKNYFHHFIHHVPETNRNNDLKDFGKTRKNFQTFVKVYEDIFAEEIHPIWFLDMCEKNS